MSNLSDHKVLPKKLESHVVVSFLLQNSVLLGMIAVLLIFAVINPKFAAAKNLINVVNQSSLLIIMACGMMMAMSVKAVDLSIAYVADAAGLLAAMMVIRQYPVWAVFILPILFGALIGLLNCFFVSYLGLSAIIATLGQMLIIRSFELMLTNSAEAQILFMLPPAQTRQFFFLGTGTLFGIPFLILFTAAVVFIAHLIRHRTVLGREMDAVGGSSKVAYLSGINIRKVFGASFVLGSVFSAVAGIALVSRTGSAVPTSVESYLMDCFVSVYLGAILSKNNRMTIAGTAIGALFTRLVANWITIMGLGAASKDIINGVIILAALSIGALRKKQ